MDIFRLVKKNMKIYSKTHQITPFKKISSGKHDPGPPNKRMQLAQPPKKLGLPNWQILHTPARTCIIL